MRARNLKPALFKNELLATSDPLYTWVFQGLWCLADREGRLEDRPRRIHLEINPGRAYEGTEASLAWLAEHGFIVRYTHGGRQYIQIVNFTKHQNPHMREPVSSIPPPGVSTERAPDNDAHMVGPKPESSTIVAPGQHSAGPADSPFPLPDSSEPTTTLTANLEGSSALPTKAGQRAAQDAVFELPDDWRPNPVCLDWLTESGMTIPRMTEVIGEFVRWARAAKLRKSEKNWNLTFLRNPKVKSAVGAAKGASGNGAAQRQRQPGGETAYERAKRRLAEWAADNGVTPTGL